MHFNHIALKGDYSHTNILNLLHAGLTGGGGGIGEPGKIWDI